MTRAEAIQRIAEAIARMEGFYVSGSVARRHNNPGNLRSWGRVPRRNGFAVFETEADGWRALGIQIDRNIERRLTLLEFFGGKKGVYAGYAPQSDGNRPTTYATFVAKWLGISPHERLIDVVESRD